MNYIDDVRDDPKIAPRAYWLNTSSNEPVQKLIAHNLTDHADAIDSLLCGSGLPVPVNHAADYRNLTSAQENVWSLLYLTGYLTRAPEEVANAHPLPGSGMEILSVPNREVSTLFRDEVKKWFSHRLTGEQRAELLQAFWKPDAELFAKSLSRTLLAAVSAHEYREHFYHCMLEGMLLSPVRTQTVSGLEAGKGRSDILVLDMNRAAVMEVKCAAEERELTNLVENGLKQIVDKQYDALFRANPSVRTVLHWSIAFCRKSCLAKAVVACER